MEQESEVDDDDHTVYFQSSSMQNTPKQRLKNFKVPSKDYNYKIPEVIPEGDEFEDVEMTNIHDPRKF